MNTLGLILLLIGIAMVIGSFIFLVLKVKPLAKALALEAFDLKKELINIAIRISLVGVSFTLLFISFPILNNYHLKVGEWICLTIGSLLLGVSAGYIYSAFRLHYYQNKLPEKLAKILHITWPIASILAVFFLFLTLEGLANHWGYPLYNGLSFSEGFVNPESGSPNLAWYALCIVTGAVSVYFICDHFAYKEWGKHGLLESTFFVAFPSGVLGARLFYVIGNWNLEFAGREFWHVFAIWEGGLTVIGGAAMGIIIGILWFKHVNKDLSVGVAVNFIVPTILFAQAIGRWGNFFNCEVHGIEMSASYWSWLPSVIRNNLVYSSVNGYASDGNVFVPLFLIEGIVNLTGYVFLEFVCFRLLRKHLRPLDLGFAYISWYGMTRVIMEPLRDQKFNMGTDGGWSWYWSIIFVAVGILGIVINHLIRSIYHQKKGTLPQFKNISIIKRNSFIELGIISIISLGLIIPGLIMFINNALPEGSVVIALVPHNIGLIMWVVGLGILTVVALPIYRLINLRNSLAEQK